MSYSASYPLLNSAPSQLTIEKLFEQLSYGELSNLSIAVEATGTIKKAQQNRIVHFANEGLKRLHARFPLIEETLTLTLTQGEDLDEVLEADVLLVTAVLTPYGESLTIQTQPIPKTLYVHNGTVHVPSSIADLVSELQLTLQKKHPELDSITSPSDLAQPISLIPELHEALTAYIASKLYATMNSQDALAMAANYRQRYEQVIGEAQHQGLLPGEMLRTRKLDMRGFV